MFANKRAPLYAFLCSSLKIRFTNTKVAPATSQEYMCRPIAAQNLWTTVMQTVHPSIRPVYTCKRRNTQVEPLLRYTATLQENALVYPAYD
jgi:hypothetical protein